MKNPKTKKPLRRKASQCLVMLTKITPLIFGVGCLLLYWFKGIPSTDVGATVLVAFMAAIIALCHFHLSQRVSEYDLAYHLFTDFNKRYADLNNGLSAIANNDEQTPTQAERDLIISYFNLCAEEHLYNEYYYIQKEVWINWKRGMAQHLVKPKFKKVWEQEKREKHDSYYGFNPNTIIEEFNS